MKKKMVALFMVFIIGVITTACGGKQAQDTQVDSSTTETNVSKSTNQSSGSSEITTISGKTENIDAWMEKPYKLYSNILTATTTCTTKMNMNISYEGAPDSSYLEELNKEKTQILYSDIPYDKEGNQEIEDFTINEYMKTNLNGETSEEYGPRSREINTNGRLSVIEDFILDLFQNEVNLIWVVESESDTEKIYTCNDNTAILTCFEQVLKDPYNPDEVSIDDYEAILTYDKTNTCLKSIKITANGSMYSNANEQVEYNRLISFTYDYLVEVSNINNTVVEKLDN